MVIKDNEEKLQLILDRYLNDEEQKKIKEIIYPFFIHPEFQRRMTNEFLHHSDISLGEHILEDTVKTFLLCQKKKDINLSLALKISMMHDLYCVPWQNNELKVKHFSNKHGFRHPIEASINAINWYPDAFKNVSDAEIIIDGILHHMYPLPVSRIISIKDNLTELNNYELFCSLNEDCKNIIISSLERKHIGRLSFSKSKFKEGRILSKADRIVSFKQIKNIESAKALLTGKNKSIK